MYWRYRLGIAMLGFVLAGLIGLLVFMWQQPDQHESASSIAARNWRTNGPLHYVIAIRVDYRGQQCFQQLEVLPRRDPRVLHNTCNPFWLELLTVPELQRLATQIAQIPQQRCYPNDAMCVCERVFSLRQIEYDPSSGVPLLVRSRSELRPRWYGTTYWQQWFNTGSMPQCGPAPRRLTFEVVALAELP